MDIETYSSLVSFWLLYMMTAYLLHCSTIAQDVASGNFSQSDLMHKNRIIMGAIQTLLTNFNSIGAKIKLVY